jgi:hypothetical protein
LFSLLKFEVGYNQISLKIGCGQIRSCSFLIGYFNDTFGRLEWVNYREYEKGADGWEKVTADKAAHLTENEMDILDGVQVGEGERF